MGNVIMKAQQIVYGASNVEKALDDLKAPELIVLNKRMAAIDEWKANVHEVTYTGSELTINNALKLPARSLKTAINAIQDLHGLPFPYVGGAYKNKLPIRSASTVTLYGVTFTFNADGTIKVNGTATDNVKINIINGSDSLGKMTLAPNTYTYSISDSAKGVTIGFMDTDKRVFILDGQTAISKTYTVSEALETIPVLAVSSGVTLNNVMLYPMLEIGSSRTSFAPYSNICPISGRTAAVITRSDGDEISEDFTIQLGTTVYGAEINWDTGVMTVTWIDKKVTAVTTMSNRTNGDFYGNVDGINDAIPVRNNGVAGQAICNVANNVSADVRYVDTNSDIAVRMTGEIDLCIAGIKTKGEMDTYLANNDVHICYALATPTTIQLTPTMLELLKGYNRVTLADGYGEIELKALVLGGDN